MSDCVLEDVELHASSGSRYEKDLVGWVEARLVNRGSRPKLVRDSSQTLYQRSDSLTVFATLSFSIQGYLPTIVTEW